MQLAVLLLELGLLDHAWSGVRIVERQRLLLVDARLALVHDEMPARVEQGEDAFVEELAPLAVVFPDGVAACAGAAVPRVVEERGEVIDHAERGGRGGGSGGGHGGCDVARTEEQPQSTACVS